MHQAPDILALARKAPVMYNELEMLHQREQQIPGSVQYTIYRYRKVPQFEVDDMGMLIYHRVGAKSNENYLELRFCISGNMYCQNQEEDCAHCRHQYSNFC